ncbi:MAG: deoxyribose-phosphate aldolase, partial [Draconibacterium sp.]|nr:deoxyribose-phosphate aldolase [Draconibacterium sp.]
PVCTVIGFPLGATSTFAKYAEVKHALQDGAIEFDMVINIGALQDGDYETVHNDIYTVVKAADGNVVKVIIETCLLTDDEKVAACTIAKKAGAHFVKTSTGFSTGGATDEDIKLMRGTVGSEMGVKASGGIKNLADLKAMVDAGANRIGASAGVLIIKEVK